MTHRTRTIVALVMVATIAATMWLYVNGLTQRVQHAESTADTAVATARTNGQAARDAKSAVAILARQLRAHGVTPEVTPSDVPGPAGTPGAAGPTGQPGPRGPHGVTGSVGPMGAPGATGRTGVTGSDGQTGLQGPAGPKGDTGDTGPQGAKGDPGAPGDTGPAGYPDQLTFAVGPITYTCTDTDGDHAYDCQPATPGTGQ